MLLYTGFAGELTISGDAFIKCAYQSRQASCRMNAVEESVFWSTKARISRGPIVPKCRSLDRRDVP